MTNALGASCAVWAPPLRRSPPEQSQATGKWRDNIRCGGSQARQSERRETGWISPAASRQHELPEAVIQGLFVWTDSWRWLGWVRGWEQIRQSRWVPAPIPVSLLLSLTHPRTTVAIGRVTGQHSRTGFDSDSMFLENYSIRGQGIIARWTRRRSHWT